MAEECPRSRVVDKTPPTRALCADGGGTPAQPRCRQDVADASAVLRSQGSARAAASPTGWHRCECCVPIARGGLRANPCSVRIVSRAASRRSLSRGSLSPSVANDAAARRGASVPRREPAPSSAWGRSLLRDHELAALGCFRLAARKPRLFETRSSARGVRPPYAGIRPFGDGSGSGFGRSSGPDLPALTRALLPEFWGFRTPRALLPEPWGFRTPRAPLPKP